MLGKSQMVIVRNALLITGTLIILCAKYLKRRVNKGENYDKENECPKIIMANNER
jgi:hypothetical protein